MYDVVIVGAGLAGLQCARLTARAGLRVLLVDRKQSPEERVHTTGIFVRKTLTDFDLPADCLGRSISRVTLYSPFGAELSLQSEHEDEFRVGRMALLYRYLLRDAERHGAEWSPQTSFRRCEEDGSWNWIELQTAGRRWSTRARLIIGADGARSAVAPALGLDSNREWIVGVEDVYRRGTLTGTPQMHCFVDPRIAPGYLAWAVEDGEETHVGVGGYADRFQPVDALGVLTRRIEERFGLSLGSPVERRAGRIPVNGVLQHIGSRRGLLIGDAAGAVSPLTAGGLDAALRLTRFAAELAIASVKRSDRSLLDRYDGSAFRSRFVSRLWMRRAFGAMRSPHVVEMAMRTLNVWPFRNAARHVFFGRGSFPEPAEIFARSGRVPWGAGL